MGGSKGTVKPFVYQSSGRWIGNDGNWSAYYVSVGTPPQLWHILPSFYGQSIYLPVDQDCQRLNISDCAYSRGAEDLSRTPYEGFQPNNSSSWTKIGTYEVAIGGNFGLEGAAYIGTDNIRLSQNETGEIPTLNKQALFAFATPYLWTGLLGLSAHNLNISGGTNSLSLSSLLRRLKDDSRIPSMSFGYQAGAYYHTRGGDANTPKCNDKTPGTLILGGYDQSRISTEVVSFTFADDLFVGLQSMTMSSHDGNVTFLSDGILTMFDTAVSEIWLPPAVCDSIASTLGLIYVAAADRYTLNSSTRATLQNSPPTFYFTLGQTRWGGQNVVIEIPYAAFDLQGSYPIFNSTTNYFPIRRGNESTYSLGRAFLQEIYLTVDWERSSMSIGQAVFESPMPTAQIVTIEPMGGKEAFSSHLSDGSIAGLAIGVVVLIFAIAFLVTCIIRRKGHRKKPEKDAFVTAPPEMTYAGNVAEVSDIGAQQELHDSHVQEMHALHGQNELPSVSGSEHVVSEISSSQVYELL